MWILKYGWVFFLVQVHDQFVDLYEIQILGTYYAEKKGGGDIYICLGNMNNLGKVRVRFMSDKPFPMITTNSFLLGNGNCTKLLSSWELNFTFKNFYFGMLSVWKGIAEQYIFIIARQRCNLKIISREDFAFSFWIQWKRLKLYPQKYSVQKFILHISMKYFHVFTIYFNHNLKSTITI